MFTIKDDKQAASAAWLWIGLFFIFRLVYAGMFPLVPDETNYWQWSRHLDWGYHDQAPLIAWAIWLTTWMCGHTELGVRLPSILAMTVASVYLALIARRWFSGRLALQTVLLSQSVLLFNIGSLLATADGLQGAAWAAAAYHSARAFESGSWRQWLVSGLWFGFGLLSKYTMVLFVPCVLVFAMLSAPHRKVMLSLKPYAACALGGILFLPVLFWNAGHHWNSLRHVAYIGGADERFSLRFNYFGDFLLSQIGLLSPLVFGLIGAAWWRVAKNGLFKDNWLPLFLFWTSLPVIAGFAFLSLHTRIYGNWPGAGYLTAVVLAALFQFSSGPDGDARTPANPGLWRWTLITSYVFSALVLIQAVVPILPLPGHLDRTAYEIRGWDLLGRRVASVQAEMPSPGQTFLFGLRYQIASELAFYVPGQPHTVSINRWNRPNVYDYWVQDDDVKGMDAVGVMREGDSRGRLSELFEKVDPPETFTVYRPHIWQKPNDPPKPVKILYIYRCYGFKGGLRWVPPDSNDIRAAGSGL